ncbi:TetR/AcrR family transcriptional regulator [Guptibacillus algicola]|uniref:TetR/AcrR family transcriptional regulator n=1 Tax=Guptibacillus algicola TaxID=225844 RepID=UPI001CD1D60E|nr:TetR/AcrR family transcriptional regulator [Alkalihalobacillus algicola]MCA0987374.1 TetR/AcrR family transcriptional regulator [Alkalihalobacillus algicola]
MSKEDKRERLIDAAYKVFAKKGFNNASIKDIAHEADITSGLVHYYFKNKEDLLISVQEKVQQRYHKKYGEKDVQNLTPSETLQEIKSRAKTDPDWYRWRYELYSLGLKNEVMGEKVAEILKNGRESLSVPIKQLTNGSGHEDQLAAILLACFDGLALQKIVDENFDSDGAYDLLIKLVEIYFDK